MWIWKGRGRWGRRLWFDGVDTQGVLFGNTLCDFYIFIPMVAYILDFLYSLGRGGFLVASILVVFGLG